ncbi:hypothetical protein EDD11_008219 [Mortierella claussenii]|nr:hypothetical protein EDD11_008219 [Mortierella claussenii]
MKERHISLFIPDSSSNSLDDGDLQDGQDSEDDCSIQDSGPLATAWDGHSYDSNDVPTSNTSTTEEDEDIEDSSGDEDNEDDIGTPDATKDYELVLGISAKNLRIVDIEEVIFTVNGVEESLEQESPSDEVLGDEILRWKLGTPKTVQNRNRMEMQIRFALKLKPMAAPLEIETFNLHYMELHALGTMNSSEDSSIRVYCPLYNWALAIRRNGADDTIPYTISESGDYLVIYRTAIELWDLTNSSLSRPANASATTNPFSISAANLRHLSLSISWDGSQIVVSGETTPFKLYERNRPTSMLEESNKAKLTNLARFEGLGSFH